MGRILAATARGVALTEFIDPLERRGFSLVVVENADDALNHARGRMPDCVLYDQPANGQMSLAERWLEAFPTDTTPLLVLASLDDGRAQRKCDRCTGIVFPELGFDAAFGSMGPAIEAHWLKQRLVEMGKLALLGEVMAGVLHELKNPVNNMLGSLERVSKRIEADPAVSRWAEIIRRNGELLRESVGSLLAGFRCQLPPQPVDVHETLDRAARYALKGDASVRDIGLIRELLAENAVVHASPGPLLHLFLNLLVNARQAIGSNAGTITLRSCNVDDRLKVEVQDSGPGIEPEMLERMFQRFQTTKKTGSGIGLMLVKSVAEQIGGTVAAENSPHGGAVFRVELPLGS